MFLVFSGLERIMKESVVKSVLWDDDRDTCEHAYYHAWLWWWVKETQWLKVTEIENGFWRQAVRNAQLVALFSVQTGTQRTNLFLCPVTSWLNFVFPRAEDMMLRLRQFLVINYIQTNITCHIIASKGFMIYMILFVLWPFVQMKKNS